MLLQHGKEIQEKFSSYNVKFVRDMTYNLPNYCEPKTLDWVYVDGDHTYDGCMKDLQAVKELVKDDGMILGHDYRPAWRKRPDWGVVESVNDVRQVHIHIVSQFPQLIVATRADHARGGRIDLVDTDTRFVVEALNLLWGDTLVSRLA